MAGKFAMRQTSQDKDDEISKYFQLILEIIQHTFLLSLYLIPIKNYRRRHA